MIITDERIKKGLTQRELAEMVGITQGWLSGIESGNRKPSVAVAKKIADVLEFEWSRLFEEDANPSTTSWSPSPLQQSRHCQGQARPACANPSDSPAALPELCEAESPVRCRGGKGSHE